MKYWIRRTLDEQEKLRAKTEEELEIQLKKYYQNALKQVMKRYALTYEKFTNAETVTPNTLYTLDRYWGMQKEIVEVLTALGDKSVKAMERSFNKEYKQTFEAIKIPEHTYNGKPSTEGAKAAIDSIWCADGKHFSQRIWKNTNLLIQELNEGLVNISITGSGTDEFTRYLMERFNVSYNRAKAVVVTEMTHIQTQATKDRYEGYGLTEYEFLDTEDKKTCEKCKALDGKRFKLSELQEGINAPSIHPMCRCTIIPVI